MLIELLGEVGLLGEEVRGSLIQGLLKLWLQLQPSS